MYTSLKASFFTIFALIALHCVSPLFYYIGTLAQLGLFAARQYDHGVLDLHLDEQC